MKPHRRKKALPLSQVYRLLEPGPVILLTTSDGQRTDVMTQSWHMPLEFTPPLVACVVSNRNYTFGILKRARECAINIPTAELAREVVGCGNTSGRRIDKFEKFRLTRVAGSVIKAPLIAECYASLECKVIDTSMATKYGVFVLQVVKAWIAPTVKRPRTLHHQGRGNFMVAGATIRLASRMK